MDDGVGRRGTAFLAQLGPVHHHVCLWLGGGLRGASLDGSCEGLKLFKLARN